MSTPYVPDPAVKARALATLRAEGVERLSQVARLRADLAAVTEEVTMQETAFYASIAPLTERRESLKTALALAEMEARTVALDCYTADPSTKAPLPGANVKVRRGVEYNRADAERWTEAKGLFRIPAALDTKALDKFLLANSSPIDLEYAITETPTVTLAADLPITEPVQ